MSSKHTAPVCPLLLPCVPYVLSPTAPQPHAHHQMCQPPQGESDAFSQETASAYAANFDAWLAATRHVLQAYCPCVPLLLHCTPKFPAKSLAHPICQSPQGESDAFNLDTASAYAANFDTWLAATRHALQAYCPCVPSVMAVMATRQRQGAFPFIDIVAEQQRGLKVPHLLKVDMAGFEFYDGGDGNLVHLTKAGCCALGGAMALEVAACSSTGC
jgi:hypothetical protein